VTKPKVVGKLPTTKSGIHEASSHQVQIFNGKNNNNNNNNFGEKKEEENGFYIII
jgi:hypothetical protein